MRPVPSLLKPPPAPVMAPLKVVLVWTDPPGVTRTVLDATPELVNDLDLRVATPSGSSSFGNESLHPGQADRLIEAIRREVKEK